MEAFLIVSLIWIFQVKSLEILRPNSFTFSTTSKASPLMRMGSNSCWDFVKDIHTSLHLSVFSWTLFSSDHCITLSVVRWALLSSPFATVSEIVVSSTYFHKRAFSTTRSLIIIKKSQGPNFVPWGMPEGTDPQSDTHPSPSLIL